MQKKYKIPKIFWKVMRVSFFQLLLLGICGISWATETAAQELLNTRLSVQVENRNVKYVLSRIEHEANVKFMYSTQIIQASRKISLKANNESLAQVLENVLKPLKITFRVIDRTILLTTTRTTSASSASESSLDISELIPEFVVRKITGKVIDSERGEPMPGVSIIAKGTTIGSTTNVSGEYTLNMPEEAKVLVFSYVGYQTQDVNIGNRNTVNVTLKIDPRSLDEVVVVGYGTQYKREITGSVASVSGKDVRAIPIVGIDQALQGRVAGVQVTQTSGQPGGSVAVRVRGVSSVSAGNEPLYVVDGVPFYNWNTTFNQGPTGIFGTGSISNALSVINPNDIESIEVLKDAAAASIYGSRAANGVVLITTKRGKTGRGKIEIDSYYGSQIANKQLSVLNSQQFAELNNEARLNARNDLGNPANLPVAVRPIPELANLSSLGTSTDWQSQIFQTAPIQSHQITISGGNDATQYAVSGGFFNQQGIIKTSGYKRFNFRINLDQKVNERLKIGTSIVINNATNAINRAFGNPYGGQGGVVYGALLQTPTIPVYNADGSYARPNYANGFATIDNPLSSAIDYWHPINTTRLIASTYGEIKLHKNLKFRTVIGLDANYLKNNIFIPTSSGAPPPSAGAGFAFASQELIWINENILTYTNSFGKHNITAVTGFTSQGAGFERMISRVFNFPNDLVQTTNGGQTDLTNSFREEWRMASFLGRINYSYAGKYLLTAAMRADGSSRFGPGRRFGYFPSISAGWNIADEDFMKNIRVISDLKLRVSYGLTGNAEITNTVNSFANYPYIAGLGISNYTLGGVAANGLAPTNISNRNLGWESTGQFDIGLDASLFKGRISTVIDYYDKETVNLLVGGTPLAFTTGFTNSIQNVGSMRNRGWEFTLNTRNIEGAFKWSTSFNVGFNRNTVLSLGGDPNRQLSFGSSITQAGSPVGYFFGFATDGIFQNQSQIANSPTQPGAKPGDIKFKDIDKNGRIDNADRINLGNPNPLSVYGLSNNFSFKGLDLSVFMQGVSGLTVYNQTRQTIESLGTLGGGSGAINNSVSTLDRWRSESQPGNGTMPRATALDPNNNNRVSDRWLEDGSFLRVRNITLGYNFPKALLEKVKLSNLRLYVSGQNLFTFTKYTGYDPEFGRNGTNPLGAGYDDSNYPVARTLLMGLNIQF